MEIEPKHITVKELVADYQDNQESGVVGYDGILIYDPDTFEDLYEGEG